MGTKLHGVKRPRMDTVQYAPLPVALLLGVWPPDPATTTALSLAVAVLIIMLVALRLRRWTSAEHDARLRAERQAELSEKLHQLVAAVSRGARCGIPTAPGEARRARHSRADRGEPRPRAGQRGPLKAADRPAVRGPAPSAFLRS